MGLSLYLTDDEADHLRRLRADASTVEGMAVADAASALVVVYRALDRQEQARTGGRHLTCCGHVAPEHYATCDHHATADRDHDDDGPSRGPHPVRRPSDLPIR